MEKHRLEDLKKMTLEELKAISRPLEKDEIIQSCDWWNLAGRADFAIDSLGKKHNPEFRQFFRPTDKPSDEIKLGWYRHSDGWFFELLGFRHPSDVPRHKCIGYRYDGAACCFSSDALANEFTYLGTTLPEPGEWVDPGEVKLSELPIRARFRDHVKHDWREGQLRGVSLDCPGFQMEDDGWMTFCQVWRPSK